MPWLSLLTDRRRWVALLLATTLAGGAWVLLTRPGPSQAATAQPTAPQIGFMAPDFQLEGLDGSSIALSDLRGQVVVVNHWASWCPPCRAEMPALSRTYEKYRDAGLVVLGVNATNQDDETQVRAFAQSENVTFPIVLDRDGKAGVAYNLHSLPTTYIIDRAGVVSDIIPGAIASETMLDARLRRVLTEAGRP
jgi:cytochrome c biogenesis protein CcmG, thiol:disulfide interchange protein DsbE